MILVEDYQQSSLGAKAVNLHQMQEMGLPIPTFCAYTFGFWEADESQSYLKKQGDLLQDSSQSLEDLAIELKAWVNQQIELLTIEDQLSNLEKGKLFAVRSSANVEDSSQMSFAGQFESYLEQTSDQVPVAILKVIESLYQPPALAYYQQNKLALETIRMTVIVQEQIASDYAGIYFTANPKGLLSEEVIVFGEGLGNGIVEDCVPTTQVYYHPLEDVTYYEQEQGAPDLPESYQRQLLEMGQTLKADFGPYLDCEFAFSQDQLYLLQVRPITRLNLDQLSILDNSNIVESYPGTTTPLSISFAKEAYQSIFTQLARRMIGKDESILSAYQATFEQMVIPYYSRLYYQIQNWYQLLQLLPFSKRIIPIWQDMLGVEQTEVPQTPVHLSFKNRLQVSVNLLWYFRQTPRLMETLGQDFQQVVKVYQESYSPDMSLLECQDLFKQLKEDVLDQWDVTLLNDLYAFIYTGLLKKRLGEHAVQAQIANVEQIASMGPALALQQLYQALNHRDNENFKVALSKAQTEEEYRLLWQIPAPIVGDLEAFIEEFGDRAPEELKMETPTFRSHPNQLLRLLQNFQPAKSGKAPGELTKDESPVVPLLSRWIQKRSMLGIKNRESSRLNRTRIYGMMRQLFMTAGQRLFELGQIKAPEDVFYLDLEQVFEEKPSGQNYDKEIQLAKDKLEEDKRVPAFSRLIFAGKPFEARFRQINQKASAVNQVNNWIGTGCAMGHVKAQVLVIDQVNQVKEARGKIIVTRMTDPGWVYILSQAAGIIAEQGSLLSHTAIISRELGIPSVVGVKGIMQQVQEGQWLEMDGQTGEVWRINHEASTNSD